MDGKEKSEKSSPSTWKARHQRRMAAKKCKEEKVLDEEKSQQGESAPQGGLVCAENFFEPLKMMLDSYEARLRQITQIRNNIGHTQIPRQKQKNLKSFRR